MKRRPARTPHAGGRSGDGGPAARRRGPARRMLLLWSLLLSVGCACALLPMLPLAANLPSLADQPSAGAAAARAVGPAGVSGAAGAQGPAARGAGGASGSGRAAGSGDDLGGGGGDDGASGDDDDDDVQLELGPRAPRHRAARRRAPAAAAAAAADAAAAAATAAAERSGVHMVLTAHDIALSAAATAAAIWSTDAPPPPPGASATPPAPPAFARREPRGPNVRRVDLRPPPRGRGYVPVGPADGGPAFAGGGDDLRVSVVIMNWAKPDSVRRILDGLVTVALVGEVIVLHLRQDTAFEYAHPRVTHLLDYNADIRYGLTSRFLGCLRARHELVLLQDDDVMLSEAGIAALVAAKRAAPAAPLVGFFGRDWEGSKPGYVMAEVAPGPHPIALTVAVLATRGLCHAFFQHSHLVEPFVRSHSTPYWNGEDIFLSLVGWKTSGHMPLIVAPPKRGYTIVHSQVSGEVGMHTSNPNHAAFRDALVKVAAALLRLPARGNGAPGAGVAAATAAAAPAPAAAGVQPGEPAS